MRASIEEALLNQAALSLRDGHRFQFRVEAIGGEPELKRFVVKLSMTVGYNVWANCGHGLVTVYSHNTDGTSLVIATIKGTWMAYLAAKRNKFLVRPDGAAEVRVELVSDISAMPRIWISCVACGDELVEHPDRHLFICPECGHEVTFPEVDVLGQKTVSVLCDRFGLPDGQKKGFFLWRFLGWFGNKKRLPAPKS